MYKVILKDKDKVYYEMPFCFDYLTDALNFAEKCLSSAKFEIEVSLLLTEKGKEKKYELVSD